MVCILCKNINLSCYTAVTPNNIVEDIKHILYGTVSPTWGPVIKEVITEAVNQNIPLTDSTVYYSTVYNVIYNDIIELYKLGPGFCMRIPVLVYHRADPTEILHRVGYVPQALTFLLLMLSKVDNYESEVWQNMPSVITIMILFHNMKKKLNI